MSLELLTRASYEWRPVIEIADQGVLGGAVSMGLLTKASSGLCRVIGIAHQGVVWLAPCHWHC